MASPYQHGQEQPERRAPPVHLCLLPEPAHEPSVSVSQCETHCYVIEAGMHRTDHIHSRKCLYLDPCMCVAGLTRLPASWKPAATAARTSSAALPPR